MIIFYRVTSFLVAVWCALAFAFLIFDWFHPAYSILIGVFGCGIMISRLLQWQVRTFQFWHLLGTPIVFIISSFGLFLLLESATAKIILAVATVLLLFIFVEHVFSFFHIPSSYQPFTLEYLTQILHILSVFSLATVGFGLRVFLNIPLWLLAIIFFPILFFMVYGFLWVGKVDANLAKPHALAGSLLITELFVVLLFLPTGFYTNSAFLALGVYVFLGLSRAQALHKLSKKVLIRYISIFAIMTTVIAATSQWI